MMMMMRIVMTICDDDDDDEGENSDDHQCGVRHLWKLFPGSVIGHSQIPQVLKCTRSLQLHNTQGLRFSGIDMLVMPKCSTIQLSNRKWQIWLYWRHYQGIHHWSWISNATKPWLAFWLLHLGSYNLTFTEVQPRHISLSIIWFLSHFYNIFFWTYQIQG